MNERISFLFTELQRQYPRYPVTMSQCACGRMAGRGGGRCAIEDGSQGKGTGRHIAAFILGAHKEPS